MNELFPTSEVASLSPKLRWLAHYGLKTEQNPAGGLESPEKGDLVPHWTCEPIKPLHQMLSSAYERTTGKGDTEEEACADFALKADLRLWNESP